MTMMDDVYNAIGEKFEGMVTVQLVLNLKGGTGKINGKIRTSYFYVALNNLNEK